jgi:pimeloyl-ACP methyl ester carboxylesterase
MHSKAAFPSDPTGWVSTATSRIAFRRVGSGPPLVLIHGWPFDGSTFGELTPFLSEHFTCFLPDTPGLGATEWTADTDFRFTAQGEALFRFADGVGLNEFDVMAHDTGGTIARLMAVAAPSRIKRLILLNTEMPGHRPPWIPMHRNLAALPGASYGFTQLLRRRAFLRSPLGFGGCFHDRSRLDDAFFARCAAPLTRSPRRLEGAMRYLRGIDWKLVDGLAELHARIDAEVLLVWGADDNIFPVSWARRLPSQFRRSAGLVEVSDACFLVHEERARAVAEATISFLSTAFAAGDVSPISA